MVESFRLVKSNAPKAPVLSVLVRVRNERVALPEFWSRLSSQSIFPDLEVLFLDSDSTDGTLGFLESLPVTVYQISREDFCFGNSCNLLLSVSRAPVACFLSGHVLIEGSDSLEKLHSVLSGKAYTAAYLRQVPNEIFGASFYDRSYLARRYPRFPGRELIDMHRPGGFSNAASGLTRDAWERNPFPNMHGSEDFVWAERHLAQGGKLFYLPEVKAMHSHAESPAALFERVSLNVRARGIKGSYLKVSYFFLGVVLAMVRQGAPLSEAFRYAKSHALAYAPRNLRVANPHLETRTPDAHSGNAG